jgi:hypothetical protein
MSVTATGGSPAIRFGTILSGPDGVNENQDIKTPRERIEEAIREIGVLLVALAPLDAGFGQSFLAAVPGLLLFLVMGMTLFVIAIRLERRRRDVGIRG